MRGMICGMLDPFDPDSLIVRAEVHILGIEPKIISIGKRAMLDLENLGAINFGNGISGSDPQTFDHQRCWFANIELADGGANHRDVA